MIGFLRAILEALGKLLAGQNAASDQVATLESSMDAQFKAQADAIEHLRVLIEGDELPATVGTPTFTPNVVWNGTDGSSTGGTA
jgi:hypothetical protein